MHIDGQQMSMQNPIQMKAFRHHHKQQRMLQDHNPHAVDIGMRGSACGRRTPSSCIDNICLSKAKREYSRISRSSSNVAGPSCTWHRHVGQYLWRENTLILYRQHLSQLQSSASHAAQSISQPLCVLVSQVCIEALLLGLLSG